MRISKIILFTDEEFEITLGKFEKNQERSESCGTQSH